jgi:hypothetical protein
MSDETQNDNMEMVKLQTTLQQNVSDQKWREISTFEDAFALAQEMGAELVSATDLGDGFALLKTDDKESLVGRSCVFVSWQFSEGEMGEFVSARVLAKNLNGSVDKVILNDGSTGICAQLRELTKEDAASMLYAPHGLRRSTYKISLPDDNGNVIEREATTYYIDTSR